MITKDDFAKLLTSEHELLRMQLDGLSHADSLIQPQPGGNCMNWVMGHLVLNLVDMLGFLGAKPPADLPDLAHYGFGSEPIRCDEAGVLDLQVLVEWYGTLNELIIDTLAQMSDSDFDTEIEYWQGKDRRGYVIFFYFFHHSYHLGQMEQCRNLAGKTEKVI